MLVGQDTRAVICNNEWRSIEKEPGKPSQGPQEKELESRMPRRTGAEAIKECGLRIRDKELIMDTGLTEHDEEKYMAIMAGHDAAIARELDELHAANQSVLDQVQALVTSEAFQQISDTLVDSGYTHSYLLTDSPLGVPQDDDFVLGDVCVDETTNGGVTGDDYAGTMSMPLSPGRYFQFGYAC